MAPTKSNNNKMFKSGEMIEMHYDPCDPKIYWLAEVIERQGDLYKCRFIGAEDIFWMPSASANELHHATHAPQPPSYIYKKHGGDYKKILANETKFFTVNVPETQQLLPPLTPIRKAYMESLELVELETKSNNNKNVKMFKSGELIEVHYDPCDPKIYWLAEVIERQGELYKCRYIGTEDVYWMPSASANELHHATHAPQPPSYIYKKHDGDFKKILANETKFFKVNVPETQQPLPPLTSFRKAYLESLELVGLWSRDDASQ